MDTIGTQHGIDATRARLKTVDPSGANAYEKLLGSPSDVNEGTLKKLVAGHNEVHRSGGISDDVSALKAVVNNLPFPFGAP